MCVCVCVWSSFGNGSVLVGAVGRLGHAIKAPFPPNPEGSRLWQGQVPNHHWLRLALVLLGIGLGLVCRTYVSLLF